MAVKRVALGVLSLLVALGITTFVWLYRLNAAGEYTYEMAKDPQYRLWTQGKAPYSEGYLSAFLRDTSVNRKFIGQPLTAINPLFPNLEISKMGHYQPDPTVFWLEGSYHSGPCVRVIAGRIAEYCRIKG